MISKVSFVFDICMYLISLASYRISLLPRWRNLNHFNHITSVTFSDARKYEDILRVKFLLSFMEKSKANLSPRW